MRELNFTSKLAALLLAAGSSVLVCGCSDASKDGQQVAAPGPIIAEQKRSGAELTIQEQLAIFANNKSEWYVEASDEWITYLGITDLDNNGRYELTVSREEAGTYVVSQFYMYEIDTEGAGITKIKVELGDAKQMPDISLNSVMNCYESSEGKLFYAVTDCNMKDYSDYEYINYLMNLEDGVLNFYKYSSMTCAFSGGDTAEKYYDSEGTAIDAKKYFGMEEEYAGILLGKDYEKQYQLLGFHYYTNESNVEELMQLSYDKAARFDEEGYNAYTAELHGNSQSVSLGIDEIGSLYGSDIDEEYLKNKIFKSFYVSNFETGVESDYLNNGGEGSRFEKEIIFFGNDGTGYYIDQAGERTDFTWSVNELASAEVVAEGDTYKNSVFGYRLVDNEGNEHQAIAFEFKNEYIYAFCE